ncbi:MAG: DUF6941 family protein [Mycobacterium sp.]
MELTALLCNHAEAHDNQLFVSGGGIDTAAIPAGAPPPFMVSIAIGMIVEVSWTETNQQHTVRVSLQDADGHPVEIQQGPNERAPFEGMVLFNVGRPPNLEVGQMQTIALAVNVPALPLEHIGQYVFAISIDGTEMKRLRYRLVAQPGMTLTPGGPMPPVTR